MCLSLFVSQQSYDILLLILMVLLLVQAILTSATVVHCATYKSQLRMGAPECDDNIQTQMHYCEVCQVNTPICANPALVYITTYNNRHLLMSLASRYTTCKCICIN